MRQARASLPRRLGCAALLFAAAVGLPYLVVILLWVAGGGEHRTIERRTLSPDRRYEARIQNDVRGSIQPIHWVVYVKPAATRSDAPAASCAVAEVQGEDGWRAVELHWRGTTLALRSIPAAATLALRRPLAASEGRCAPIPVELVGETKSETR